jgi:hypothetical protein
MINYTLKKEHQVSQKGENPNYYHKKFALALINYEINRQEERLSAFKTMEIKR